MVWPGGNSSRVLRACVCVCVSACVCACVGTSRQPAGILRPSPLSLPSAASGASCPGSPCRFLGPCGPGAAFPPFLASPAACLLVSVSSLVRRRNVEGAESVLCCCGTCPIYRPILSRRPGPRPTWRFAWCGPGEIRPVFCVRACVCVRFVSFCVRACVCVCFCVRVFLLLPWHPGSGKNMLRDRRLDRAVRFLQFWSLSGSKARLWASCRRPRGLGRGHESM